MDFKGRDQTWTSQFESIFRMGAQNTASECGQTVESKNSFKQLLHRRMRLWWNKATLENYLLKNLIPRGLRVQVFPSFPMEDTLVCTKWEEASHNCSKIFIELLIGMNKKNLDTMELEIETLQTKLVQDLSQRGFEEFKKELEAQFEIWEKDIKEKKSKKFQRDVNDFQTNRIYKWPHGGRGSAPLTRTSSTTSISSVGSLTQSDNEQEGYHLRRGYTRRYDTPRNGNQRRRGPNATKDLNLFARKLVLKKLFDRTGAQGNTWTTQELEAIQILEELERGETNTEEG